MCRRAGGSSVIVARDGDPETRLRWRRTGGGSSPTSEVDLEWSIPADVAAGTYRLIYRGRARSAG
ncbi:MAG: neutral/alkaline non-lysosomal ceramidase C-terminal domain-containing protein [Myxococcales bacterium]|nr:neutral/alkaline non-lysosomal ceramidase C-terminal domain-containing protein [Myxococcales bacterium]